MPPMAGCSCATGVATVLPVKASGSMEIHSTVWPSSTVNSRLISLALYVWDLGRDEGVAQADMQQAGWPKGASVAPGRAGHLQFCFGVLGLAKVTPATDRVPGDKQVALVCHGAHCPRVKVDIPY